MLQCRMVICVAVLLTAFAALAETVEPTPRRSDIFVRPLTVRGTGDLDAMVERRVIRVLTVYSKTFYFIDNGTQRGTAYDAMKLFEDTFNKKLKNKKGWVHVAFIPVSRGELLPALLDGRGDIAAANLTITAERQKVVDFVEPLVTGVSEIVVTGPASPAITSLDDLAGKEIFVRAIAGGWQARNRSETGA
jgi:membrane-bound lytic murein transglycosylase MltF